MTAAMQPETHSPFSQTRRLRRSQVSVKFQLVPSVLQVEMVKSSSQRVSPGLHCWVPQRPSRQNSPVAQSSATKPVPASLQRFRWVEETQPRT